LAAFPKAKAEEIWKRMIDRDNISDNTRGTSTHIINTHPENVVPEEIQSTGNSPMIYRIQSGDTLAGISSLFQVPISEIMNINGMQDANRIHVGQEIIIPPY
jgi:LysM repeat protein